MIKVDKNIPIPKDEGVGRPAIYPWLDMEVGDSFFVPNKTSGKLGRLGSKQSKNMGIKFMSRTENNGTRIWRIK